MDTDLPHLADLCRQRNALDARIAALINRPAERSHIGEFIASRIFDIDLEASATSRSIDGRFRYAPLTGRSVNVKFYGKCEGLLEVCVADPPEFYLVLSGGRGPAASSRGRTRPLIIEQVHLFDSAILHPAIAARGVKVGIATSVGRAAWDAAEVFPRQSNPMLPLSPEQQSMIALFSGDSDIIV